MNREAQPTPTFVKVDPASSGRIMIHVELSVQNFSEQCREAALWMLELTDRFQELTP